MSRLGLLMLAALLTSGCPDTELPVLGVIDGTRVCSFEELEAFQDASFSTDRTDLWIAFVDVGQGDGIWIRTPGAADIQAQEIIIDGGDCRVSGASCAFSGPTGVDGAGAMVRFLTTNGWTPGNPIHYLVSTHSDIDHVGAQRRLLNEYNVRAFIDSGMADDGVNYAGLLQQVANEPGLVSLRPVLETGLNPERVGAPPNARCTGLRCTETWGRDVQVELLSADGNASKTNDSSVVLMVEYRGRRILLAADMEDGLADTLIDRYGSALRADVFKAGHHGGSGTSSQRLLDTVFPENLVGERRYAIISSGRRDNLPAADTFDRLIGKVGGTGLYRTDRLDEGKSQSEAPGDDHILVRVTADGVLTVCYAFPDGTSG